MLPWRCDTSLDLFITSEFKQNRDAFAQEQLHLIEIC
jgi:hypothetical protein